MLPLRNTTSGFTSSPARIECQRAQEPVRRRMLLTVSET